MSVGNRYSLQNRGFSLEREDLGSFHEKAVEEAYDPLFTTKSKVNSIATVDQNN